MFKLKGKDRIDTVENYSIFLIFAGAAILSIGIGLSAFNPKGISAILAMTGSFIAFVSTVFLIFLWLYKEIRSS